MDKIMMVGCDLHDRSMLLKIAIGVASPDKRSWSNDRAGRKAMIGDLKRRAGAAGTTRIVFAYEASGLGFTLYDELTAAGIECHVLAPTLM
jgi:transposase